MNSTGYIGQTLDGKYQIERELGRGGMGTVYLATHVGTERHVAVKIIAPQFMERLEFVERFRREARAAGRLRHPNVVNVTDFGFSESEKGRVAYLVMEYLDGCTLGEILDEEHQLPLAWSLDILEQISSAVHAAHEQGIIHRDLKPDNIWLEPNQRGGYTVKVLDFGIAKLEEQMSSESAEEIHISLMPTQFETSRATVGDALQNQTIADVHAATNFSEGATLAQADEKHTTISEKGTLIQPVADLLENGTLIQPKPETVEDKTSVFQTAPSINGEQSSGNIKSLLESIEKNSGTNEHHTFSENLKTEDLTRVGAVLGTPLFMSPEQCRGEKLTSRSDIYSLGVISYLMLSGKLPFEGEYTQVMEAHKELAPPLIEAKKVPPKVKNVIFSALSKNPLERPPTAEAFASEMRAQSTGVLSLFSSALVFYSENIFKFLSLAVIINLPMMIFFLIQIAYSLLTELGAVDKNSLISKLLSFVFTISAFFSGTIMSGIMTWLVVQKMAVPMRPLKLRPAFYALRKRFKTLVGMSAVSSILVLVGFLFLLVPGVILYVCWALVTPAVMVEGLKWRGAFARSTQLVRRNLKVTVGTIGIYLILSLVVGIFAGIVSKGLLGGFSNNISTVSTKNDGGDDDAFQINFGNHGVQINTSTGKELTDEEKRMAKIKGIISETAYALIQIPFSVFVGSFFAVALALLYIKTRLAGGESMSDLLEQFEENEQPQRKWQERMNNRLMSSGRITSKS